MVVSPTACRQTFKLKVRICKCKVSVSALNMSRIVKHGKSGLVFVNRFSYTLCIIKISFNAESVSVFFIVRILSFVEHFLYTSLTIARQSADNIKENTVAIVFAHYLLNLCKKIIEIRCVHTHTMISRLCEVFRPIECLVRIAHKPFSMRTRHFFIKSRRDIHGSFNSYFVSGGYLLAEKVKIKVRVHFACFRREICPAVMAFCKESYRIYMSLFKCFLELLL